MKLSLITLVLVLFSYTKMYSQKSIVDTDYLEAFIVDNYRYNGVKYESFKIGEDAFIKLDYRSDSILYLDLNHDSIKDIVIFGNGKLKLKNKAKVYNPGELFVLASNDNGDYKKINIPTIFYTGFSTNYTCTLKSIFLDGLEYLEIVRNDFINYGYINDSLGVSHSFKRREEQKISDTILIDNGYVIPFVDREAISIKSIEYSQGYCYGRCPVFSIRIENSREVIYDGKAYTNRKGIVNGKIYRSDWDLIESILKPIVLNGEDKKFSVNWTDDQTAKTKIFLSNGKVINIEDYGKRGSLELALLYQVISNFVSNIN